MGYIADQLKPKKSKKSKAGGGYISRTLSQTGTTPTTKLGVPTEEKSFTQFQELAQKAGIDLPTREEVKKGGMSLLNKALDVYATSEYAMGGFISGKGIREGIKQKISPSKALGIKNTWAALATDIFLDPLTYLTFGSGAAAKGTVKIGGKILSKKGKKVFADNLKKWVGKGLTKEAAEREAKKAVSLQVMKEGPSKLIEPTSMRFMGKKVPVVGEAVPRAIKKPFQLVGKGIEKVPGLGEAYKAGKADLVKKFGSPFAEMRKVLPLHVIDEFESAHLKLFKGTKYEQKKAAEKLIKLGREAQKVDSRAGEMITKALETATPIKGKGLNRLNAIAKVIEDDLAKMAKEGKAKGILDSEIENYVAHALTPEGRKLLQKEGGLWGFLGREYKTGDPFAKGRQLIRAVDEAGKSKVVHIKKQGLRRINKQKMITALEEKTGRKVKALQKIQEALAKPEINLFTGDLLDELAFIKKHVAKSPKFKGTLEDLIDPTKEELDTIIKSIVTPKRDELELLIKDALTSVKLSQGKEFLKGPLASKTTREAKLKFVTEEIKRTQNLLTDNIRKFESFDLIDQFGKMYKKKLATIDDINEKLVKKLEEVTGKPGLNFFEPNIFKSTAARKFSHIKAVKMQGFFDDMREVGEFATKFDDAGNALPEMINGIKHVPSKHRELRGMLFPEALVKEIDKTHEFLMNPKQLGPWMKAFDTSLSVFKGLHTWPSAAFHLRNLIGGYANNFLAGMRPDQMATRLAESKKVIRGIGNVKTSKYGMVKSKDLMEEYMKRSGEQIGHADIMRTMEKKLSTGLKGATQRFVREAPSRLFDFVETQIRLPLFIDQLKKGATYDEAIRTVFKYQFDYSPEALTAFEREVMRRVIPFYRWMRGNIPLQLESLFLKPGKYSNMRKVFETYEPTEEEKANMPNWMKEKMSFKLPPALAKLMGGEFVYGIGLPFEDINRLYQFTGEGLFEDLRRTFEQGVVATLRPGLKRAYELASGRDPYFGESLKNPIISNKQKEYIFNNPRFPQALKDFIGLDQIVENPKDGKAPYVRYEIRKPMNWYMIRQIIPSRIFSIISEPAARGFYMPGKIRETDLEGWIKQNEWDYWKLVTAILEDEGLLKEFTTPYIPKNIKQEYGFPTR